MTRRPRKHLTGGEGLLGSHLCGGLLQEALGVLVVDNSRSCVAMALESPPGRSIGGQPGCAG